jgi:hypothetical protein
MAQPEVPAAGADVTIDAPPDAVYALITDLPTLVLLGDEVTAMHWRKGTSAQPRAVFKGENRNGSHKWTTTCRVTEADPGNAFAFDVSYLGLPIARWRYDIEALGSEGCRVTEQTWDRRPAWFRPAGGIATGIKDRAGANSAHIKATLQRLKERAER